MKRRMKAYIRLIRPEHYIKNFLLVLPAFFAGNIFDVYTLIRLGLGFIAFSFAASTVYILNDIKDVEKDRRHEVKRNRPIASGLVSCTEAVILAILLFVFSQAIVFAIVHSLWHTANILLLLYVFINIIYSFGVKNKPIADVMILATGFVLRVLFGGLIVDCIVSQWLCLTIMMFSLYMGLGKRRNELRKIQGGNTRKVLKFYTESFFNGNMLMSKTLGLMFYSLWSALVVSKNNYMIWTVPLVLAILMKYELDIEGDSFGDPVEVLLSDKGLVLMVLFYVMVVLWIEFS